MISVCIIGSCARGSSDEWSDRDLLAVGCEAEVRNVSERKRSEGWNVAEFTQRQFEHIAFDKSLFVQHVKQDGRIIRDDNYFLQNILGQYERKSSYLDEIFDAAKPIMLVSSPPRNYWSALFKADVLYVTIRNLCILHRATISEPVFDYRELVNWISPQIPLSERERNSLVRLRNYKSAYRDRLFGVDLADARLAFKTADKLYAFWMALAPLASSRNRRSNGYYEVRRLEGILVSEIGPLMLDGLGPNHVLYELWSVICNPSGYRDPRPKRLPVWTEAVSDFLSQEARSRL